MTAFAALLRPDRGEPATLIRLVDKASAAEWLKRQPAPRRALLDAMRFDGSAADRDGGDPVRSTRNLEQAREEHTRQLLPGTGQGR